MQTPEVSVIVPLFNEADNLVPLVREITEALEPTGLTYELLFIDDASTDPSPEILLDLARANSGIRILRRDQNAGLSAGLDAGFRHARGEILVTLDADLQNDPADIPMLLEALPGFDVVCGIRRRRHDSWLRKVSSRVANSVRNAVTHESVTDVGCTLRVFRREATVGLTMFDGLHRFLPTILRLRGARIREVEVNHRPRMHGESKYNIRNRLLPACRDLLAVRWMQSRWVDQGGITEVETGRAREH